MRSAASRVQRIVSYYQLCDEEFQKRGLIVDRPTLATLALAAIVEEVGEVVAEEISKVSP